MKTTLTISPEIKERLQKHIKDDEVLEDVVIRLLDLDDKYGDSKPIEFEVEFSEEIIKVFRLNNNLMEYFTPARKFSVTLSDWNLPDEFYDVWVHFATHPDTVSVLLGMGSDDLLECSGFRIMKI